MLDFFKWLETLKFGSAFDDNGYFIAAVNVSHLLALTVFLGAAVIVDIRLLGRGLSKQPLAQVAREAHPWLIRGFLAVAFTGVLQILSTPMKAYYSDQFWLKMQLLIVAVIFTFFVRRQISQSEGSHSEPGWWKAAAIASILLWVTIAAEGRLIGLLQ